MTSCEDRGEPVYSNPGCALTMNRVTRRSRMRLATFPATAISAGVLLAAACREAPITTLGTPSFSAVGAGSVSAVNVSRDTTSQNETPIAVNPANPLNMIVGANDWNYNDGCSVNATFDGGKTWTPTLP